MTDDEYERTLDAGAELYAQLKPILDKYKLEDGHAPSLVAVCMAGILKCSNTGIGQIVTGAELIQRHWHNDPDSTQALNAVFDAPHLHRS